MDAHNIKRSKLNLNKKLCVRPNPIENNIKQNVIKTVSEQVSAQGWQLLEIQSDTQYYDDQY